ncbi:hypothetical protein [Sphingorhabdus contaminans]|uniref:hypothetical protein n=1 Tax=Sphingorhabdus contaminans TaxID=1343899 RepID=UPI003D2BD54A
MLAWLSPVIFAAAAAGVTEAKVASFGDWLAGCSNENICTAIRMVDTKDCMYRDGGVPFLQIRHHPHRDAIPEIRLIDPENPTTTGMPRPALVTIVFRFNDNPGVGNILIYYASIDDEGGYRFDDEDARFILYGLRRASRVIVSIADKRGLSLNAEQIDDALAYFDRQQGLDDTPGALVLRPDNVMYDYAHPVPPEADTVQLSTYSGEQLHNWMVENPERTPDEIIEVEPKLDRGLVNVIRAKSLKGDCGVFERWGHVGTGNEFVLVERREMPLCRGTGPARWIQTYRADTLSPEE